MQGLHARRVRYGARRVSRDTAARKPADGGDSCQFSIGPCPSYRHARRRQLSENSL